MFNGGEYVVFCHGVGVDTGSYVKEWFGAET